ncbi:hypothetical protein ABFV78_16505, partial [Brucella melitensis]
IMMGQKITVVVTDNRGFGCISRLQMEETPIDVGLLPSRETLSLHSWEETTPPVMNTYRAMGLSRDFPD